MLRLRVFLLILLHLFPLTLLVLEEYAGYRILRLFSEEFSPDSLVLDSGVNTVDYYFVLSTDLPLLRLNSKKLVRR